MQQPPLLNRRAPRAHSGFTIIEIVVIVIIIGLMLIIIVPHFFAELKIRKAQQVRDDLEALQSAIEHYALDNGKTSGAEIDYADVRKYLDPNSNVSLHDGKDVFGDAYGPFTVGSPPSVPAATSSKLAGAVGEDFWSPFQ